MVRLLAPDTHDDVTLMLPRKKINNGPRPILYYSLSESTHLPCAKHTAKPENHTAKSLSYVAHGKLHTTNKHRQRGCLPCAIYRAHGKEFACRVLKPTLGKYFTKGIKKRKVAAAAPPPRAALLHFRWRAAAPRAALFHHRTHALPP
jgi:hypothetical protein